MSEIKEGERRIAEFMELRKLQKENFYFIDEHLLRSGEVVYCHADDLKYHSDANWQDSVLKKISELGYSWNINYYLSYNAYQAEIYSQKHGLLLGEVKISGDSKPEVVFELLCKFCDYINQKEK